MNKNKYLRIFGEPSLHAGRTKKSPACSGGRIAFEAIDNYGLPLT